MLNKAIVNVANLNMIYRTTHFVVMDGWEWSIQDLFWGRRPFVLNEDLTIFFGNMNEPIILPSFSLVLVGGYCL